MQLAATGIILHHDPGLEGMFGVALSALGMLGTLSMALTIVAFGPSLGQRGLVVGP